MSAPRVLALAAVLLLTPLVPEPAQAEQVDGVRAQGSATITGTVRGRFEERGRPLAGAFVDVRTSERRYSVETNDDGRYVVTGLPAGPVDLRVAHPGHHAVSLTVHAVTGRSITVDLELTAAPLPLDGVHVLADAVHRESRAGVGSPEAVDPAADPGLEIRLLEISPSLGEAGIAEAVQSLPGNDPADPSDVLFMRGTTTDLKLVLLDGIPVYTPFHVAGLLRSFEPTVLGQADLHVGGASARYDGGLTHILDLRTRSPRRDRVRATGSVDFLSASMAAEIPLGSRAGLLASARTLHDFGTAPLGGERPYGYGDVLVKVDTEPTPGHQIRGTGFWNGESVRLDFPNRPDDARWSNQAGALAYEGEIGSASVNVTAGGSRYDAELPLQPTPTEEEPEPSPILASAQSDRLRLEAGATWARKPGSIRSGISLERIDAAYAAHDLAGTGASHSRGRSVAAGAFVETVRPLSQDVSVRLGLRGDVFSGDVPRLSPRVALFWALAPEAILSVAAGRYHQVTRTPDSQVDETLEAFADGATEPEELLPVATADHVVLGLDQRLGEDVSLGIQGFWKRFDGLAEADGESVRNSGIDVQVLTDRDDGAIWLGYGLSWFWSATDLSGRSTDFAGRHLLSAGISGGLFGPLRGEARVAYGAGLPSTSLPFGSVQDAASQPLTPGPGLEQLAADTADRTPIPNLDESFLRVDLELHAVFEPTWGSRSWRVRPYLRLLNALDRRDALFYTYQPWRPDAVTPLAERPILPVLGVAFSF